MLSTIFLLGLPSSDEPFRVDRYRRAISQVCLSWRALCLNTPLLWRLAYIEHDGSSDLKEGIDKWGCLIGRARQVPLDLIVFLHSTKDNPITGDDAIYFARWTRIYIARCRTLRFTSNTSDGIQEFFPLPKSVPHLRLLELHLVSYDGIYRNATLWPPDCSMPALRSLTIDALYYCVTSSLQSLSIEKITHLDLSPTYGFNWDDRTKYMARFPSLRSLSLHLCFQDPIGQLGVGPRISSQNITSLKLNDHPRPLLALLERDDGIRHLSLAGVVRTVPLSMFSRLPALDMISMTDPRSSMVLGTMLRFISRRKIYAIELLERFCRGFMYSFFPAVRLRTKRTISHTIRFVRIIQTSDSSSNQFSRQQLSTWLGDPKLPRIEWVYKDFRLRHGGHFPQNHQMIMDLAQEFSGNFTWKTHQDAIPFDQIQGLEEDGWPTGA